MGEPVLLQARAVVEAVALLEAVDLILLAILVGVPDGMGRLLLISRRLVAGATRRARKLQAVPVDPVV